VRLRRLQLRRAPGIDKGFDLEELSPGLNLVVGPNGSGKSTVCRVLRATLWPEAEKAPGAEAVSQWEASTGSLRAELADRVRWQREGVECPPPSLPAPHLAAAYTLGLRDLLDDGTRGDRELARQIQLQMAGGYDLAVLRGALQPKPRFGSSEEKELGEARRELSQLLGEQRRLATDQAELADLRSRLERAEAEAARRDLLTRARDLAVRRRELTEVGARRTRFAAAPEAMDRLSGDELDRLAEIEADAERLRFEQASAQQRVARAQADREACGLEGGPLASDALVALERRADRLVRRTELGAEAGIAAAAAEESSRAAWRVLAGEGLDSDRLAGLDASELERLSDWSGRALRLRERQAALEGQLARGEPIDEDEESLRKLARAVELLRDWLERPARAATLGWLGWIPLALLVVASAVAPRVRGVPVWPLGAAAAGALVLDVLRALRSAWKGRRDLGPRLAELGIEPPAEWLPAAVRERLAVLEGHEKLARERAWLRDQLGRLGPELADIEAEREGARVRFGLDRALGELAWTDLLDRVRAWRDAETKSSEARARHAALEREYAEERDALRAELALVAGAVAPDALAIQARIQDLRSRCERWRDAERAREAAERERDDRADQLARCDERRRDLFVTRGIEVGDGEDMRRELERRVADLPEWKQNEERYRSLLREIASLESQLEGEPGLRQMQVEELEARLQACAETSAGRGELQQRIGDIQGRVRDAIRGTRLEEQRARVAEAEAALASRRDELLFDLTGDILLQSVEREYEEQSQPQVLRSAADLFARFTRHRYGLVLDRSEGAVFRAVEVGTGEGLSLSQLSDGTRMQLLLAARLAFATAAETSHSQPPLLLDEALTASDPERFEAVATSLLEWSKQGRQIFYLTCNPADVHFWQAVCRTAGAGEPRVIDLGELRGLAAGVVDAQRLRSAPRPPVPAPGNLAAAEYAVQLGVPPPDPFAAVGALHLFHLLRGELPLLYRILSEARVQRLGEWRSLRAHGEAERRFGADACARVDAWVSVVEAFLECWRIGRGRPVDRRALEESGAVSESFIDGLSEKAGELDGDARLLMQALEGSERDERIKGFRTRQRDALRAHLEEHGHLPTCEPLDPVDLRGRVLARVADRLAGSGAEGGVLAIDEVSRRIEELMALLD